MFPNYVIFGVTKQTVRSIILIDGLSELKAEEHS